MNAISIDSELFEQLDTTSVESLYSVKVQRPFHQKLIVSIMIDAYSRGVLFQAYFKQTIKLAMELKLASVGHISLDGSKFKADADTSKHKAKSFGRLKTQEQVLCAEIEALIEPASRCDQQEDQAYRDTTGYAVPEDLQFKPARLAKIQVAKQALEEREAQFNPAKTSTTASQSDLPILKRGSRARTASSNTAITDQPKSKPTFKSMSASTSVNAPTIKKALNQLFKRCKTILGNCPSNSAQITAIAQPTTCKPCNKPRWTLKSLPTQAKKPLIPRWMLQRVNKLVKADFTYHDANNTFTCPSDQTLTIINKSKDGRRVYQGPAEGCAKCPFKPHCC